MLYFFNKSPFVILSFSFTFKTLSTILTQTVSGAAKEAQRTISLICSVCLQREISDSKMQTLEHLIAKWQEFLRLHASPTFFPISEHYLSHLPMVIRMMGPMPQYSCRVLERRIQTIKKKIYGHKHIPKQAENAMMKITFNAQAERNTIDFSKDATDAAARFSKTLDMNSI